MYSLAGLGILSRPQWLSNRPAASEAKHAKAALPGTVLSQAATLVYGWGRGKRASTSRPQLPGTVLRRGTWARSHSTDMFIPQWSTSLCCLHSRPYVRGVGMPVFCLRAPSCIWLIELPICLGIGACLFVGLPCVFVWAASLLPWSLKASDVFLCLSLLCMSFPWLSQGLKHNLN